MSIECLFTIFMTLKTPFQNISKAFSHNVFKRCHNRGNYGKYKLPKAISKKNPSTKKYKAK